MAVGYKIYLHTNTDQPEQHQYKMISIKKICIKDEPDIVYRKVKTLHHAFLLNRRLIAHSRRMEVKYIKCHNISLNNKNNTH
jgi:hypothetical protein